MTVQQYFEKVIVRFKSGINLKHSYRVDLLNHLKSLASEVQMPNEPTRIDFRAVEFFITERGTQYKDYQPAQKWLKDRKGWTLSFHDILHYQKIIVALVETDKLMKEIDEVIEL